MSHFTFDAFCLGSTLGVGGWPAMILKALHGGGVPGLPRRLVATVAPRTQQNWPRIRCGRKESPWFWVDRLVNGDPYIHQTFLVPKMEILSLIFSGWIFPYISRIHTAYIGEYLYFRYLTCLVIYWFIIIPTLGVQSTKQVVAGRLRMIHGSQGFPILPRGKVWSAWTSWAYITG